MRGVVRAVARLHTEQPLWRRFVLANAKGLQVMNLWKKIVNLWRRVGMGATLTRRLER